MKKYLIYFLVLSLSGFLNISAHAANIFVDRLLGSNCVGNYSAANRACNGSDGNAFTSANINNAIQSLNAGDFLLIRDGSTYPQISDVSINWPAGTSNSKVTIQNYSGETVVIAAANQPALNQTKTTTAWTVFKGIKFSSTGTFNETIGLQGNNLIFDQVIATSNGSVGGFGNVVIVNAAAHHNTFIGGDYFDPGQDPASDIFSKHGYVFYVLGSDNLFNGVKAHNARGYGFHIYRSGGSAGNTLVTRNRVTNSEIYDTCQELPTCAGVLLSTGDSNQLDNSLVYDITGTGNGAIACVHLGTGSASNSKAFDNTFSNCKFTSVSFDDQSSGSLIKGNILSNSPRDWYNTSQDNTASPPSSTINSNRCEFADGRCITIANPQFVNAGVKDFGLQSISTLRDLCSSNITGGIVAPFNGTNRDCGALETWGVNSLTGIVGNVANNILEITLPDNTSSGPAPASGCTGFSVSIGGRTISSCNVVSGKVRLTLSSNVNQGESGTWSYTPGNVTNSINIGGSKNQRLNAISATSITNQVQGGGVPVGRNMSLTWQDLSNNETGFRIYRANQVNGIVGVFSFLNSVNPGVVSYTDSNTVGEFCYRITSFNTGGESNPSNIVCSASIVTPPMVSIPNSPGGLQLVIK